MTDNRTEERSIAEQIAGTGSVYYVEGDRITNAREHSAPPARELTRPGFYLALTDTDHCSGPFWVRNASVRSYWYEHWRPFVGECPVDYEPDATDYPKDLCALWVRLDQDLPAGMLETAVRINGTGGLADLDHYGKTFDEFRSYGGNAAPTWKLWTYDYGRSAFRIGFIAANEVNPLARSFADIPETVLDTLVFEASLRETWRSAWAALRNADGSTAQMAAFIDYCKAVGREGYAAFVRQYPEARMERTPSYKMLRWQHLSGMEMTGRSMHPDFRNAINQNHPS